MEGLQVLEADLAVRDCLLFPMDGRGPIRGAWLAIRGGRVVYAGRPSGLGPSIRAEEVLDGRERAVLPGFINCHTHAPMTLLRGLAEDVPLDVWLREHIWPVEARMKPEDVYAGALLACLEMSLSGTTCFCDMYFHEGQVAEAVLRAGLRAVLAPGIMDVAGPKLGELMLSEALGVAKRYHGAGEGRIKVMLGPHAIYTCSRELLERVRDEASRLGLGIHIHLSETEEEVRRCLEEHGRSPVQLLDELGLLGPRTLAAHCIHLSDEDISILAGRGVKVAHCPVASAKIGAGVARIPDLLAAGVVVGLGTDGPASNNSLDMLETVKFACLLQKAVRRDPTALGAREALEMATVRAAEALGLSDQVGCLGPGGKADLVVLDLGRASTTPLH
ncbi:N-ethylammeline chlorohydrolase, partial [Candidatus Bathyarchaeota archaeon]